MVLLHGTSRPPDRPWKDAPHVEFRLYKDPIKMTRSYHSMMVHLKRLVIRESSNEIGGTNFITNKDSINTTRGNFNVHKIPQLPVHKEKYFVVVLYPPTDLGDEDVPMKDNKPIKLLHNFSSFYLIGFDYNEIWRVFNDATIIGISQAAKDMYVQKLPFAGNYNAIGQNYLELIVGFRGQCDTYNNLAGFGGTTTEGQLIRSLCRTIITVPESTRFYFLQQFNLRSFYSGNFYIVLDSPVQEDQDYKNLSFHLTSWDLYSTISKNGEDSFSITSVPGSGMYSFNDIMNFIALATNKDDVSVKRMLEHKGKKNHNNNDDHIDDNERGDQGQDSDEEDDGRLVEDNKEKTWFYQAPVLAYVPKRQNKVLIPELGFEIPPEAQRGTLSTVEGSDIRAVDELEALQDETKAEAVDQFFMKLRSLGSLEAASYRCGKGFIESRTSEHQAALSFLAEPTEELRESSMVGACSGGMKIIPHGSVGTVAITQGNSNEISAVLCRYSAPEEVAVAETAKEMVAEFMPKLLCGPDMVELAVDAECAQDWDPATVEDCHRPSSSHHHHHHDLDDGQHEYPLGRVGIEA
ncbi:uncharacterized protein [Aegilops tauschii subsp. strangulata]|nr:uncharacterized protein LOC109769044 [Aegilops tauschii subsp. strangulata]